MSKEEHEWQTRKERIDKRLTSLSSPWKIEKHYQFNNAGNFMKHTVEEYRRGMLGYTIRIQAY